MRYTFILIFTLCSFASYSQDTWTLERCIEYALDNNLTVKTNALTIQTNQESLILAEHARYPNLNVSVNHGINLGRFIDPVSNLFVSQTNQSSSAGINGSVTLYNGGKLTNSITQSELNIKASEQDLAQAKNTIVLNLTGAYMNILFGLENLANAKLQVQSLNEQIERTQKLVDAGVLPKGNLLDLQSQNATNELQVVQAENAVAFSTLQLKQFLQLPIDQGEGFKIAIPTLADPNTNEALPTAVTIYTTAENSQPDVKSADLQAESADLGIKIARADYKPTVSITYSGNTNFSSLQRNFTYVEQLYENRRGYAGVSVSIPIYNRNQIKSSVNNAIIQRDRARLNQEIVRNNLRQTIEQAYQDAVAAGKTYEANSKQVEALEETFRMTQERFNLGVSNITDFNVAQNNLNVAKSNLIRAKYDYILKVKILDFYMGKTISLD